MIDETPRRGVGEEIAEGSLAGVKVEADKILHFLLPGGLEVSGEVISAEAGKFGKLVRVRIDNPEKFREVINFENGNEIVVPFDELGRKNEQGKYVVSS
jgi:hypothetical protein